jgi:nitrite reductase/ring-hydroxylating ferredoxin subunit
MERITVGKVEDFPSGTMKAVAVKGLDIVVVNSGGKFYAINRKCTHRGGDLSLGTLEGSGIRCPEHHSLFDLATGKSVEGPKIGPMKLKTKDTVCYPVIVEGRDIKIQV